MGWTFVLLEVLLLFSRYFDVRICCSLVQNAVSIFGHLITYCGVKSMYNTAAMLQVQRQREMNSINNQQIGKCVALTSLHLVHECNTSQTAACREHLPHPSHGRHFSQLLGIIQFFLSYLPFSQLYSPSWLAAKKKNKQTRKFKKIYLVSIV